MSNVHNVLFSTLVLKSLTLVLKSQLFVIKLLSMNSLIKLLYSLSVWILTIFQYVTSLNILKDYQGPIETLKPFSNNLIDQVWYYPHFENEHILAKRLWITCPDTQQYCVNWVSNWIQLALTHILSLNHRKNFLLVTLYHIFC